MERAAGPADGLGLGLGAEDAAALLALGTRRRFERGSIIFLEGEDSDRVLVVERGRVKISTQTSAGDEVLLAVRGEGEVLGEVSAVDGEPRSATVTAIDDVTATIIAATAFREFLASRPGAALAVLRTLTRRLRDSDRMRLEFTGWDSVGRVARRLVELAAEHGEPTPEGVRITLPLSQQELAAWTASSREAVSKALRQLRARGWITTRRRGVVIRDLAALRRRAAG